MTCEISYTHENISYLIFFFLNKSGSLFILFSFDLGLLKLVLKSINKLSLKK